VSVAERLTLFLDIAGRVTRASTPDSYITVGGVLVPTSREAELWKSLSGGVPKWRDATRESLDLVQRVVCIPDIQSVVLQIEKKQPEWNQFWDDGDNEHKKLSGLINEKVGFARPGTVTKYLAFGECSALGLGEKLRREGVPQLVDQYGFGILRLRVIHDIDIQGEDNQDTFSYMWKTWAESTQMRDRLHLAPTVDAVEFRAEEDDPVLLLPDYLAGLIHYRTGPSVIEKPKALQLTDIETFVAAIDCQSNVLSRKWSFGAQFPNLTTTTKAGTIGDGGSSRFAGSSEPTKLTERTA